MAYSYTDNSARSAILTAMNSYESKTCITFAERNNDEEDYVRFFSGEG